MPTPPDSCSDLGDPSSQADNSKETTMADDRIKVLEERLTRLEAALSQRPAATAAAGFATPGGAVVDPPPWPIHHRLPPPIVDMAPWWGRYRWPHPIVDPGPFPTPVVDPGPFPTPVIDPAPFPNPVVDPAPGVVRQQAANAAILGRIGHVGDPPPPDITRFTAAQLETTLHSIAAEKARLSSMETMINQHLDRLKEQGQR